MTFEAFFLSREPVCNPVVAEVVAAGRHLGDGIRCPGTISVRYGNRMLITGQGVNLCRLEPEDLVEVADYDPVRQTVMVIGPRQPSLSTPLHWFLYRRPDVHAAVQTHGETAALREDQQEAYPMEMVMEALRGLRDSAMINLGGDRLAVGPSLENALEELGCK
ncbi:MAG TPA: hypothetical protein ENN54_06345 [Thermoplasmatales archaeon]|nr:hypothetical protein [Thermoplasmatales archaeon]